MNRREFAAKLMELTPLNPVLAFINNTDDTEDLREALNISAERSKTLGIALRETALSIASDGEAASDSMMAVASYICATPQELMWLALQIQGKSTQSRDPLSSVIAEIFNASRR